ncbi:hypothetical protein AAVH_19068 [Aphelenchoides avenae]|nr:hypothetical protein AAVH_19068 [Aphelenchus avenae]
MPVDGKYDEGDGWPTGWWNAYSGTSIENTREIVRNGFHLSKTVRKAFGNGIYCTPDPIPRPQKRTLGKRRISQQRTSSHGASYLVLVQVRVDSSKCEVAKATEQSPLKDGEYWTVTDSDAIRPYAICLFKE